MNTLKQYYEVMTTEKLTKTRLQVQAEIENNDERLTAHSSEDLDHSLDKRDVIDNILLKRLTDKVLLNGSGASKT